ncbi:hypothetical protein A1O7_09638, partial [Cladophialophora yegresii CBS 114405]
GSSALLEQSLRLAQRCLSPDLRIPRSRPRFGPSKTLQAFHLWLRGTPQPQQNLDIQIDHLFRSGAKVLARYDAK